MEDFGKRLKKLLDDNNINQKEFALKIGITEQAVSNYINRNRLPTAEILMKMKQSFNFSIDWLLLGDMNLEEITDQEELIDLLRFKNETLQEKIEELKKKK